MNDLSELAAAYRDPKTWERFPRDRSHPLYNPMTALDWRDWHRQREEARARMVADYNATHAAAPVEPCADCGGDGETEELLGDGEYAAREHYATAPCELCNGRGFGLLQDSETLA